MRVYLQRVRLTNAGYDRNGCYWGVGAPLYYFETEDGSIGSHVRAHNREHAKDKARELIRRYNAPEPINFFK